MIHSIIILNLNPELNSCPRPPKKEQKQRQKTQGSEFFFLTKASQEGRERGLPKITEQCGFQALPHSML